MIFLSFDIEEFDVPRETNPSYNVMNEGMQISIYGTERILEILNREKVTATFFCTANFALKAPGLIRKIKDKGHEIASHGYDHWDVKSDDAQASKKVLEEIVGEIIVGYRQPRMFEIGASILQENQYLYNASLNPTYIPGRYMRLFDKRLPYKENAILNIPASVTPVLRIPLFWAALHIFPTWLYKALCFWTIRIDRHFNTYFHPWEFYPLKDLKGIDVSPIILKNSGDNLCYRLTEVIRAFKRKGNSFGTYRQYYDLHQ